MGELAGRYRLGEVIGTGGTATVYRATDLSLGVERAVKVLRVDAAGLESQRARLRAEARAMARVTHPNILRVYDVGTDDDQDFVVMELAVAGSLQDRLDAQGPLPPLVACRYALQVLGALAAAHDAGVIHRDVKPQNVLLDTHGVAMLADFGIALLSDGRESRHTSVGVAMGSMTYMPPEQRLDARGVGVGADIYAAGATLYALLTGASPVDLFLAARGSVRWEDVPDPLRPTLQRATRLLPSDRFASARDMAAALLRAMAELPPDPDEHPDDDQAWKGVQDRVLRGLELDEAPRSVPVPRAPAPPPRRPARPAGVDPTIPARPAVRRPGKARWIILGAALWLSLLAGAWAWRAGVAPKSMGGVLTGPRPPARPALSDEPAVSGTASTASDVETPAPATTATASSAPATTRRPRPTAEESAPTPEATTIAPIRSAVGRWTGSFGGRTMEIDLTGKDAALRGTVTVRFQGNAVVSKVKGSFDPEAGRLDITDLVASDDSGRYVATVTSDSALDGRFEADKGGRVVSFRVKPAQ